MDKFVNILTDPFMGTRAGSAPSMAAGGYADEDETLAYAAKRKRAGAEREAYAAFKAPPRIAAPERRWSVWSAGYGGTQQTDGDAEVGSQKLTNHVYGGAAGFDYRLTPETLVGFALGGAGTSFGLANGLGGGRSEVFQAGLYARHTSGPAYVTGALAWGWQDVTFDRSVFGNRYRADFDANALTGRLEGGWRFAYGTSGITPYEAGQVTGFFMPGYAENFVAGVNTFALAYSGKDVTASRAATPRSLQPTPSSRCAAAQRGRTTSTPIATSARFSRRCRRPASRCSALHPRRMRRSSRRAPKPNG